jgi:hypothetical protein
LPSTAGEPDVGYDLHITRAAHWLDSQDHPITPDEWEAYARRHPQLHEDGTVSQKDIGDQPMFTLTSKDGTRVGLFWDESCVDVCGVYTEPAQHEIAQIAEALQANLIGDDGERYEAGRLAPILDRLDNIHRADRPGFWSRLRRSRN